MHLSCLATHAYIDGRIRLRNGGIIKFYVRRRRRWIYTWGTCRPTKLHSHCHKKHQQVLKWGIASTLLLMWACILKFRVSFFFEISGGGTLVVKFLLIITKVMPTGHLPNLHRSL
ncbi:hypothetical protein ACJX0J_039143 [Zea mays]